LSTLAVFQDMTAMPDDAMLKACTGLEGGVVASGSTCGIVTGGVLSIACAAEANLLNDRLRAQKTLMERARRYVSWFEDTYRSSLCRDCTGVDFYTTAGQLRYLLPGDKPLRCFRQIRGATRYLCKDQNFDRGDDNAAIVDDLAVGLPEPVHCAAAVLEGIRRQTGIGNLRLERLSFVLDGGVAYSGGVCGALAGAVMAVNIILGFSIRRMSYRHILAAFVRGHANLLLKNPVGRREPFAVGKDVVVDFRRFAGSVECRIITGRSFSDGNAFQRHMTESRPCHDLIDHLIRRTSGLIHNVKSGDRRLFTGNPV
jgi:hypothetical protein